MNAKVYTSIFMILFVSVSFGQIRNVKEYKIKPGESYSLHFCEDEEVEVSIVVSNISIANIMDFTILGAPLDSKASLNGRELDSWNGYYSILPNRPYVKFKGYGKFKGRTLRVSNLTDSRHPAVALLKIITLSQSGK